MMSQVNLSMRVLPKCLTLHNHQIHVVNPLLRNKYAILIICSKGRSIKISKVLMELTSSIHVLFGSKLSTGLSLTIRSSMSCLTICIAILYSTSSQFLHYGSLFLWMNISKHPKIKISRCVGQQWHYYTCSLTDRVLACTCLDMLHQTPISMRLHRKLIYEHVGTFPQHYFEGSMTMSAMILVQSHPCIIKH